MKPIRICILTIMLLVMSVPLTSTSFAAVKDYGTLQWDINLDDTHDEFNLHGTVRITLTGVVGEQIDKYHVKSPVLPNPDYYIGPFVGHPDYSPKDINIDYNAPITGWSVYDKHFNGEGLIVPEEKVAQTLIQLAEKSNAKKVSNLKIIPIVEGAKMTVELLDCSYFQLYQFHYNAFPGTNPLLLTEIDYGGTATHYFNMWAIDNEPPVSRTFKKITNENGSFRIYPFQFNTKDINVEDKPLAFYVVTEAEAKALIANPNNLPTEMRGISTAEPTASKAIVNEKEINFDAYSINGKNYCKLRDLAKVVSGTDKQFAVGYDNGTGAITLTSGIAYTDVGGELAKGDGKAKPASTSLSKININGKEMPVTAYTIGGNNYFKLSNVAKIFNFDVGYDVETMVISIDTKLNYWEPPLRFEAEKVGKTALRWNAVVEEHADASGGKAVVNIYQDGDSIRFSNCPSAKAISVGYATASYTGYGVLSLYINDSFIKKITFPSTGAWDKYQKLDIEIDIPDQASIMFRCNGDDLSTNIDYIDFYEYGLSN